MDIADPAVVRLLNPNQYTEESVFAAEDSEIPGAGEAAADAVRDKQHKNLKGVTTLLKLGGRH
jgi:hypothetical protein